MSLSSPTIIEINWREALPCPKSYSVASCSADTAGFGPAGVYFIQCDLLGMTGESLWGPKRSQIILPVNTAALPTAWSEYMREVVKLPLASKSNEPLQSVRFWITDVNGNRITYNTTHPFCLEIRIYY